MALSDFVKPLLIGIGSAVAIILGRKVVQSMMGSSPQPFPDLSREFTAGRHGGARNMDSVRLIVLHATDPGSAVAEPTARSTAMYFVSPPTPASTQAVIGEDGAYRTLDDDTIPYGAGSPANERGLHVEQAGHSYWTREQWLAHDKTLRETGGLVGGWAREYNIPMRFLRAPDLVRLANNGWQPQDGGITTHAEITKAFHATTHTDPGDNYPIDVLMGYAGGEIPDMGQPIA